MDTNHSQIYLDRMANIVKSIQRCDRLYSIPHERQNQSNGQIVWLLNFPDGKFYE